jgi:hypothetical protein
MNFSPLMTSPLERTDIIQEKRRYGVWYGLAVGGSFALFTWGVDSYTLSLHHGLLPWLKFMMGAALCMTVGAAAGRAAAVSGKSLTALIIWLIAGSVFAWLTIHLPLTLLPRAMALFEPDLSHLLHYEYFSNFQQNIGMAYVWLGIFLVATGILQIPMSDTAVFSTSVIGRVAPLLIALMLMGLCGSILDNELVNPPLRDSTLSLDRTLQFILENRGQAMEASQAREMHVGAFRTVEALITPEYRLIVSGFESDFVELQVLVKFESAWVECKVVYNQPVFCELIESR